MGRKTKGLKKVLVVIAWILSFVIIIAASIGLMLYSMNYQSHKTQQFFMAFSFGLAKKIFLSDAIFLVIQSGLYTLFRSPPQEFYYHRKSTISPHMVKIEHLTTKLNSLKRIFYFFAFEDKKHDAIIREAEKTREHYKDVVRDLVMFLFYSVTLFLVVTATKDNQAYYSKESIINFITKTTVYNAETHSSWISSPIGSSELFHWLNTSFINNINDGEKYTGEKFEDPGWVTFGYGKVLGVTRLRQQRKHNPNFESKKTSGWKKSVKGHRYQKDFYRVTEPWIYRTPDESQSRGIFGNLFYHPGGGYIAQLGRTRNNTQSVLNFLQKENWHDANTEALFIEFCLYNVDTNLFIIVNIVVERTPFQFNLADVQVEPVKLLAIIQSFGVPLLIAFYIYLVMIFIFCYVLASIIKNGRWKEFISEMWNIIDSVIVLTSVVMLVFYLVRSDIVKKLLIYLEDVRHNEFVSFDQVLNFEYIINYTSAFLICITIVRLWKILHFSAKFRIFTVTLKRSARELFATAICMAILFIAFSLAAYIINGNHSEDLRSPFSAITQSIAYGLGFGRMSHADELFKGGKFLGPILGFFSYVFLVGVCAIFMVNMFVAVACIYLSEVQQDESIIRQHSFSFWKFIKIEYGIHHLIWKDMTQKRSCSKSNYPYYE